MRYVASVVAFLALVFWPLGVEAGEWHQGFHDSVEHAKYHPDFYVPGIGD